MKSRAVCVLLFCIALPALFAQAADPLDASLRPALPAGSVPDNVWATGSMAKVQPDAAPGTARSIDISSARNEFESFQIHVRAASAPLSLTVTVSDLVNSSGRIASDANISVMSERYINVATVSDLNGIAGQVPDPLVPAVDSYFHQKRNGFPLAVPANQNRSIWVDVFVPPKTASGYYTGTATVRNGDQTLATVPIRLAVWDFDLPSTATLKTAFGAGYPGYCFAEYRDYAGCARYPASGGSSEQALALVHAAMSSFFLEHRVSISGTILSPTSPQGKWKPFDQTYGPLLSGTAKTALPGAALTSMQYPNGKGEQAADLKDYASHFSSQGWLPKLFVYQCDEPPAGCTWASIAAGAQAVHRSAPGVSTLVTTSIARARDNGALNDIDILVPVLEFMHPMDGSSQRAEYDAWLKTPGKQLWWYQSCDQHISCDNGKPGPKTSTYPSYMIDASPVRNRIFQWMAYLYQVQGELYYAVDNWGDNPWDHLYFAGGNGDGALYYPGTTAQIGGTTPIPVSSIRLKLIRDGMEDYEYMAALARAGQAGVAEESVRSFITNAFTYQDDPAAMQAARERMGAALHKIGIARGDR